MKIFKILIIFIILNNFQSNIFKIFIILNFQSNIFKILILVNGNLTSLILNYYLGLGLD